MTQKINKDLRANMEDFHRRLAIQKNFDIICRTTMVADRQACFYFIDGFVKDDIIEKLMEFFYSVTPEDLPKDSESLSRDAMPYVEVELLSDREEIENNILSGVMCLFIDGFDKCFAIDCRTYPMRSVQEPEKDKVLRGSKDGFVETVVFNTALIRRRIRDNRLVMEMQQAGSASKTDIVLCYMEDRVDQKFLEEIRARIQNLKVEALTMNQESLVECLYRGKWYNPFPNGLTRRQRVFWKGRSRSWSIIHRRRSFFRFRFLILWKRRTISIFRRLRAHISGLPAFLLPFLHWFLRLHGFC